MRMNMFIFISVWEVGKRLTFHYTYMPWFVQYCMEFFTGFQEGGYKLVSQPDWFIYTMLGQWALDIFLLITSFIPLAIFLPFSMVFWFFFVFLQILAQITISIFPIGSS